MTRQQALDAHRRAGLPTLAVLPIHYPRELLESLDVLGIELWGPPTPVAQPSDRVQPYVCSLVRNALGFLEAGGLNGVDGILVPNTCDSMMGLASLIEDLVGFDGPLFHLHLPRTDDPDTATRFLHGELDRLWTELASAFERPRDDGRLAAAIEERRHIERATRALREHRRALPQGERELTELLRADGWRLAGDQRAALDAALARRGEGPERAGSGVLISGIVPEPMALLDALDEAGAVVVAEDYAALGRRLSQLDESVDDEPLALAARRLATRPPCPTLTPQLRPRADHLVRLARGSGAAGVILHTVRFCEPELFDVPALRERMEEEGLPLLIVDTELEHELPGPLRTRLEAFVEMLT